MRAAIRTGLLGTTIAFTKDHPSPVELDAADKSALKPNQVLIKVKSAGINPVDYKLPRFIGGKVVGIDVAGVVEKVGDDDDAAGDFKVGDAVFGRAMTSDPRGITGSLADYAVASADELASKPESLTFEEAGALPTAYLTGLQSLRAGSVDGESSVLVIGASGGCGLAGMQLALALGAKRVVGVCSGKNFAFVKSMLGGRADAERVELVDYTNEGAMDEFKENNVGKFDCIYDTATGSGKGENYVTTFPKLLKDMTGQFVMINGGASVWARHALGRSQPPQQKLVVTAPKGKADLEEIATLLEKTGVKPNLNVMSFDEKGVTEGFELLKSRRTKGKIVFSMV